MGTNNFKEDAGKGAEEKIRSFIAIPIPEELKQELGRLEARLKRAGAEVKWVKPESIHITLRFLGYLSQDELNRAGEAMAQVAKNFSPFLIEAKGWGTFPENRRPRVVWAGLTQGADVLMEIFKNLEQELVLRNLGEADRPFSGHLTLGRVKTGKNLERLIQYLNREGEKSWGVFEAKTICLFQSQLQPTGAVYTVLREEALSRSSGGLE